MEDTRGFKIITETEGLPNQSVCLQLKGQLTWTYVKQFQMEVTRLFANGYKDYEIDLRDLVYLDSAGLASFIPVHEKAVGLSGSMKITNPRRLIRQIFVSAHLDCVLDIGPDKGA